MPSLASPSPRAPHGRNIRGHQRSAGGGASNRQTMGFSYGPDPFMVGFDNLLAGSGAGGSNTAGGVAGGVGRAAGRAMKMPGQTVPNFGNQNYKPVLPGLSTEEEFYFNQIATDAASDLERARKDQRTQLGNLNIWASQADNALQRDGYQTGTALREQLSDRGLGFSPMFLNRGMRDIAGQVAAGRNDITGQRAAREEALKRMVENAELSQRRLLSSIESQRAIARSNPSRGLLGGL